MAYGFKLGQIEGLDSSVKKVNLTITGTTTASYVLNYGNEGGDEGWTDNVENPNFSLHYHLELNEYVLIAFNMDESDVGDEYTINLSLPEAPTQAFTEAVDLVTEAINVEIPYEYGDIIQAALNAKISAVMSADGKPCVIYGIRWERESATDKDAFDNFYNSIAFVTNHPEKAALMEDGSTIFNKIPGEEDCSITISTPYYEVSLMAFSLTYIFHAKINYDSGEKNISCNVIASYLTEVTN